MTEKIKAAFIFVAPNAEAVIHQGWVKTEQVEVKTIAVANYHQGCSLMHELIDEGITVVELCGGFGHKGVAAIVEAAKGKVHVGVVRFDYHPGLRFSSGDNLFQ